MTLTEFLLARIADLEALARAARAEMLSPGGAISTGDDPWPSERAFAEYVTPARVLAECEAKRWIVGRGAIATVPLRALALPYADHPDYDESWRP